MSLVDKLKTEKTHSTNLKSVFLSKGWKYDYCNNSFSKGFKNAYFNYNTIIFHFNIPVSKYGFNPIHKIEVASININKGKRIPEKTHTKELITL